MPDSKEIHPPEKLQMQKFGEILQKFGLDLIQSIGEMKHTLSVLTEKIEKIEYELIEIKGIKAQLQENSRLREEFILKSDKIVRQLKLLHSKVDQYNVFSNGGPQRETQEELGGVQTPKTPYQILLGHQFKLEKIQNVADIKKIVADAREELYFNTGGHKILQSMREFVQKLEKNQAPADQTKSLESIIDGFREQFHEWLRILEVEASDS